jgi:hypothetical protein
MFLSGVNPGIHDRRRVPQAWSRWIGGSPIDVNPAQSNSQINKIKARMSSTLHAVMRAPNVRTGCGYRPDLTPAHHVERDTGMMGRMASVPFRAAFPMI